MRQKKSWINTIFNEITHLRKFLLIVIFIPFLFYNCAATIPSSKIYIRVNQVGYLPDDMKTAVVLSENPVDGKKFSIKDLNNGKEILTGELQKSNFNYGDFKYCYTADFSKLNKPGKYLISLDGNDSYPFIIGKDIYNNVVDSLMQFFREQRCGPTDPILHGVCHLYDVSRLIGDSSHPGGVDVTGGWHDAGDYIKFLSTTAYTTYMLIFSYDFDKEKFGFDDNHNGVPDVLEEAKIGVDWLLRCNYNNPKSGDPISKYKLVTQVQDLRDHEVGWRMPENDTLRYDRVGFVGIGKNQIGMYAAVMALASRVWAEKFFNYDLAKKCLEAAETFYAIRNDVPDIDTSGTGMYRDVTYKGKLALGAIELYLTTKKQQYLEDAMAYADSAKSDYWWSYGNLNSLADYRLAKIEPRFAQYILNNLIFFNNNKDSSLFNEAMAYSWGTTNSFLGAALQEILYKNATGSSRYDSLALDQRDYVLGRNPWGLSFIYNIGSVFPKHLHSQVGYFHGGYLPGALAAGPAPESTLKEYKMKDGQSRFNNFNTDRAEYFDNWSNYITNEPTIIGNATAVFVYGYYSNNL